jgi:glycerol-3-phosphate cytidylyltransferase
MMKEDLFGIKIGGFTCSAFDLLHAGHILMLEEAKKNCDYLIVGLQNDPSFDRVGKNKPIQSLVERYIQLKGVKYVDEIVVYNTEKDLEDLLMILDIQVRFVGEEYKDKPLTGRDICTARSIKIHYNKRQHSFSTTELRSRIARKEAIKELPPVPGSIPIKNGGIAIKTWPPGAGIGPWPTPIPAQDNNEKKNWGGNGILDTPPVTSLLGHPHMSVPQYAPSWPENSIANNEQRWSEP